MISKVRLRNFPEPLEIHWHVEGLIGRDVIQIDAAYIVNAIGMKNKITLLDEDVEHLREVLK
jgi:hypothetical protein